MWPDTQRRRGSGRVAGAVAPCWVVGPHAGAGAQGTGPKTRQLQRMDVTADAVMQLYRGRGAGGATRGFERL